MPRGRSGGTPRLGIHCSHDAQQAREAANGPIRTEVRVLNPSVETEQPDLAPRLGTGPVSALGALAAVVSAGRPAHIGGQAMEPGGSF